jgi:PAS domain S-box-containing protein
MIKTRSASDLRRKAEDKVVLQQQPVGKLAAMRLLHELQVHQVELEMQNEELRQVNEELRSAKEQLLHLASFPQLNPNPVLEVDATGKVTYSNPATQSILKMLGIAEDDASAFVPPDLKDIFREWDRKNIFSLHRELLINDRYFLDVISFSPQSNVVRIYAQDITERKQTEKALLQSEEQFRTLADAIPHLCWMANTDGWIFWYNQRWYEFTGTTPEQMEGWGWQSVHDPELLPQVLEQWKVSISSGNVFEMEFPLRSSAGVFRSFLTRAMPVCDQDGKVVRWFGTNTDISEQKQTEDTLQGAHDKLEMLVSERTNELAATVDTLQNEIAESERMAKTLLRNNRLYAVLCATNQAIVHASDSDNLFREFCRIAVEDGGFILSWVGLLNEESSLVRIVASCGAVGYLEGISISTNDGPFGAGPTGIAIREGRYYVCNDFLKDPITQPWHEKGRKYGIKASASVALKEDGRVIGSLTLYADEKDFFDREQEGLLLQMGENVSFALENMVREANRKKAELSLYEETLERLRAVEALREKDQMLVRQSSLAAIGEMINNIAHQWRQPLNVISLIIQSVQLRYESGKLTSEEMSRDIQNVMGNIMHMSQTIEDFRNFFKQDKVKQEFFISNAVNRAITLVSASLENHNIKVEIKTEDDATVIGYQNEYSQVLLNIISNTCDACIEHSVPNPLIFICIARENDHSVLYIRDNCGGIPDDVILNIFDPYFTTRGTDKGTGIGLYMSKMIIEQNMNGHLTASNAGGGAEFRIEV